MFNANDSNNSFIWLVLLILIFFNNSSSTPISQYNYFKLTDSTNNTNNWLNGILN